jgi:uncharacterized protein (DUF885 family)
MNPAQLALMKKIGLAAVVAPAMGIMTASTIFAASYFVERRKILKRRRQRLAMPIADYNEVVKQYNAVIAKLNAQIEESFPDVPKLQLVIEQIETAAYNEEFNGLMNEHW